MNKKIIFCFLTALVVLTFKTNSSYSIPTIPKYDENYWTPEKMKRAKPLTTKNIGFRTRRGVEPTGNATDSSQTVQPFERKYDVNNNTISEVNVDQIQAFPIGLLLMSKNGQLFSCTASVINTDDGNIALTAAHCLYDHNTQSYFDNIMFSPGFDHEQAGPLGLVPAAQVVVTNEFLQNNDDHFDWGMLRLNFNREGHPLKDYTGALGWRFQPGDDIPTTIRGYPDGGNLANCPNDGLNLCTWQGQAALEDDYYVIDDLELGNSASGAAYIMNYDPNANLGLLYSDYASFDEINDQGLGPIYDPIEFQALIGELTIH